MTLSRDDVEGYMLLHGHTKECAAFWADLESVDSVPAKSEWPKCQVCIDRAVIGLGSHG